MTYHLIAAHTSREKSDEGSNYPVVPITLLESIMSTMPTIIAGTARIFLINLSLFTQSG